MNKQKNEQDKQGGEILNRMLLALGQRQDKALVDFFGKSTQAVSNARRGNVPLSWVKDFCKRKNVSLGWLLTGDGPMLTNQLEFTTPSFGGAMTASQMISNVEPAPPIKGMVPLISWVRAGDWSEIEERYHQGDAEEWMPTSRKYGPHTYALRVRGDSMTPRFQDGCIIIVDPDSRHDNLSFVVVRLNGEETTTFKQLIIDAGLVYLKPLNERYPMIDLAGKDWKICGVVREKRDVEEF